MYTLLKAVQVGAELSRRGLRTFDASEFKRIFNTSSQTTKYFLETQVDNGFLTRLRRGVYALKTDPPAEEEIANAVYRPSYISMEYALAYHHLLPEMPYAITSVTTKPTRLFEIGGSSFFYRTIKKEAYSGYSLIKEGQKSFLMADREKALVDYLYFFSLRKSPKNERLFENIRELDKKKILMYVKLFGHKGLLDLASQLI